MSKIQMSTNGENIVCYKIFLMLRTKYA